MNIFCFSAETDVRGVLVYQNSTDKKQEYSVPANLLTEATGKLIFLGAYNKIRGTLRIVSNLVNWKDFKSIMRRVSQ